ncbi:DUF2510 domain-containing protein [Protaetiibacter mangrovi]|uniref:DUF2510 domain-containing protein n=1 Tax=Protaetiibacter mangrovi TaxID=2970926 RepID=A0ABT1ZEF6_9MICO|nr:DUF2510 domain-containing protein [Protaetiibacter mangrovi]MCS0499088.1 DUF2510 domain-containing protein [Protaetiibacter mangrovi]
MTDDRQVPAGWYPDPLGLPQLRWWDGQGWAEHTSEARRPLFAAPTLTFADPADEETLPEPTLDEVASAGEPGVPATPLPTAPAGPAAITAGTSAPARGWGGAALTIHSMRAAGVPTVLDVEIAGHPPLEIDLRDGTYTWELGLDRFPAEPASVAVAVRIVDATAPVRTGARPSVDGLLWKIGFAAFTDGPAPWVRSGDAYRMRRWPDLSGMTPETDPLRQAAMLSNGTFTVEQLAGFTGRSIEPTRALINALSLMGVLEIVEPAAR